MIAATILTFSGAARADTPRPGDQNPEPPAVASRKQRMTARDSAEKREGTYVTGVPLVGSDPDTGFGFGAVAYLF